MPGVIDFERENDRRLGIIADSWRWQNIRLQLNETMATSELPETLLISAGLCALLDMLEGDGLSRRDAKAFIARSLNGASGMKPSTTGAHFVAGRGAHGGRCGLDGIHRICPLRLKSIGTGKAGAGKLGSPLAPRPSPEISRQTSASGGGGVRARP